jgi:hypothetical protein
MTIRISRNEAGNCINFVGTTNPAYWNACLSAQINSVNSDNVDIINDIRTEADAEIRYEFFDVPYAEFSDKDGNDFDTVQDCVDYINANANVVGLSEEVGKDMTGIDINFRLDATSTTVLLDNGFSFPVNSIKAVPDTDGTVHINAIATGSPDTGTETTRKHLEKIEVGRVYVDGTLVPGGLNDVVNVLNELFTVGGWTQVIITDPYSTMVADVNGATDTYTLVGTTAVDPVGDDIFTNSGSGNYAGLKSDSTISRAGEYFTFDIRGEGQIGFGLIHSDASYASGLYTGNASYANPSTFAVSNSAHYGFQFSHWFHPTPNGSWTNYGASTGYIGGAGWSNWESRDEWLAGDPVKIKVGIDENGFIAISSLQDDGLTWVLHARTTYPAPQGSEFHLGIKAANSSPRVYTVPKIHELTSAPAMYFRYIESPDGTFQYPLFATSEEANYYDLNHDGTVGTGTSHTHVYPDDPTATVWYMPDTGATMVATSAPTGETFGGNAINYTEISSLTNAALVPTAFTDSTVQVNELQAVNIQVVPAGASWTTTITDNDSSGLTLLGSNVEGTAPEVTDNNVNNPSDDYTITVTRTNSYGSSTGTLTVRVMNLTAPATAISGFNHHTASDPLVDSDTMDDGSAIHMNNTLADARRFVIPQAYVETNILPALQGAGDKYYIGLAITGHDFATVDDADFDAAIVWEYESSTSHTFKFMRDGSVVNNVVISSLTDAFYDYAIEINGTSAWLIACNVNSINTEPSPADGGSFSHTYEATTLDESAPHTIHMAVVSTQGDFSATDLSQIDTPVVATNQTSWTKALDFSGSNEHAKQVSNSTTLTALRMYGSSVTVPPNADTSKTASDSNSKPWATTIVFKADLNSSTQHIWNQGEGASSGDDNIYLKVDGQGQLQFNWGRVNAGSLNQCRIASGIQSNTWYGVYIAHKGTRLSGANATASNLADAFDIRLMSSGDSFASVGSNLSTSANWTSTGGRMDRSFTGDFTIGGRGGNRSFHGKVASMVITTLRADFAMPTDAEIELMITDPKKWEDDYRVGQFVRWVSSTSITTYNPSNYTYGYGNTQIWLMGDGSSDSYANGIRNEVYPSDQNYTKLNMISMVSNDIENVTIAGLT